MLVILKPIYLYYYTYIYDPAGHQLLGGALGGGHPGGHQYQYQQEPQQAAFQDFGRTINSIRNGFQNDMQGRNYNYDYIHSCPTSPPTAHPQFMPQNWQFSPPQQQQQRRSPSPTSHFQPQPQLRAQSVQPQNSPAAPRRQPFPLRKPEVTVKEYPGCASTGNYRLNCSNNELTSSGQIDFADGNSVGSPHLLRPSKFWPLSQQQQHQRSHQQLHQLPQQQMHRQTSQPSLPTTQQQTNPNHNHVIVLKPQNTSFSGGSHVQPRSESPSAQQYSKYRQSAEDLQSLLQSLQQRQQQQPKPVDNFAWTNSLNRGMSKSSGQMSPSAVEMMGYNRSNSAFSRPLQAQGSRQVNSYHLQEPFEPAFGRQAITPPPGHTYDYHRTASPPPPLVKPANLTFGRSQSGRGSFSGESGGYLNHRANNGSNETMDQYHSASSSIYSSKPNLIVVSRSPMGSSTSVHQQTQSGQSSPQPFVPQSPGAKPFYYSFRL